MSEAKRQKTTQISEKELFVNRYEQLKDYIIADLDSYAIPKESRDWISKMLTHNVMGGKMNRGLSVIETFRSLVNERPLSQLEEERAHVLGWCVEWLQAFFLVADDIMDQSQTRRGEPCWYKMPGVGNVAINDSFILESCIYKFLRKHFRGEKYYVDLLELMHETTYQTELGQLLDLITAPEDEVDLGRFSMEKYKWIVKYKTAYYSFYLPVALAMLMAGHPIESPSFAIAEKILLDMGEYFQVQDDYLDCFGDPAVIGKIGTDIQDNKCSWLVNKALEIANESQKAVLKEHYGRKNEASISKVKALYKELQLERIFQEYEEESYKRITGLIEQVDDKVLPRSVFTKFMGKIYKRTK